MPVSSVQYGQTPWHYANGLQISNNAVAPDTIINISAGSMLDSTGNFQLSSDDVLALDVSSVGLNGLDTGTFAASSVYAIYLVGDPVSQQVTGAMASLSLTAPVLPFGYSAFGLIGFITSDADADILLGYWTAGNSTRRTFMYAAPLATAVTAGNATTFTAVNLSAMVPAVDNTPVIAGYAFTPGAASRTFNLSPGNDTANTLTITGQVTAVVVSGNSTVFAKVTAGVPEVDYKVANTGDAVAINVVGYDFFI